jgi:antirestriction protein ArdC
LIAEFGAALPCGYCGNVPQTLDNIAAYLAYWIERLQKDKALVIRAASQAQHAVDFILNVTQPRKTEP